VQSCTGARQECCEDVVEVLVHLSDGLLDVFLSLDIQVLNRFLNLFFVLLNDLSLSN